MLVTMSDKELRRINVIQSVVEKRMRRRDAVQQLALTERQTQRLMNRFRESGAAGLTNLRRGRPGNHRLPESLKLRVLSLLHALKEWKKLGHTIQEQFKKKYKIKLRGAGYRLVYSVEDEIITVTVIGVGKRENDAVYKVTQHRS